jgi:cupin fold WbuC family metalloprotein
MKIFNSTYLNSLTEEAKLSSRQRQHRNIHLSYEDPCQRLFNAIEPSSYIRPHRHTGVDKNELLIAMRGLMAFIKFDAEGAVSYVQNFGSEYYGDNMAVGLEVPPDTWHTVIALVDGSILLEVKAGPFDPAQPKEMADWAPVEGGPDESHYLNSLHHVVVHQLSHIVDVQRKMRIGSGREG